MRRFLLLITLFGLLALPGAAAAAPNVVGQVEEFPLGAGTRPEAIVAGPDGNLWFAGVQYLPGPTFADVVGRVTPSGKVTEFQLDTHSANLGLSDIAVGPDGNLWFTVGGRPKVGRITTAGVATEFELPSAGASPASIVAGSDGNLWFTEWQGGKVGRITPSGEVTEFPLLDGRSSSGIAAGPDGALWITEPLPGIVARIGTDGSETDFPLPDPGGYPGQIVAGSDGALWVGKQRGGVLGRITTAGEASELPVPGGRQTFALSSGPYGDVWYGNGGGRIGWVIPGVLTGTAACINSCRAPITALTEGPDGKLWFAAGVEPGVLFTTPGTVGTYAPPPLEIRLREESPIQGSTLLVPVLCRWAAKGRACNGKLSLTGRVGGSARMRPLAQRRLHLRLGAQRRFRLQLPASVRQSLARSGRLVLRLSTDGARGPRDVRRVVLTKSGRP
jgi:virginiamycin B lyase